MGIERQPSRRDGRERLLTGAAALLGERGYAATELRDVAERGEAPRGSIYHHFPGGKSELAGTAAERTAQVMAQQIESTLARCGVLETIERFAAGFRRSAGDDPARLGCPVAAVALADEPDGQLAEIAARAFAAWRAPIAAALRDEGVEADRAQDVAALVISAVEGALLQARAARDLSVLDDCLAGLETLLAPLLG